MFNEKEIEYIKYIQDHRMRLVLAFNKLTPLFKENGVSDDVLREVKDRILMHDLDKYNPKMFYPFRERFFINKGEVTSFSKEEIKDAVMKHQRVNSHHPESHNVSQPMTMVDTVEMLCDWESMSVYYGTKSVDWYNKTRSKFISENPGVMDTEFLDKYFDYSPTTTLYTGKI